MATDGAILVVNCGSSSVKFAMFASQRPSRLWSGELERIGLNKGRFTVRRDDGAILYEDTPALPDHNAALDLLLAKIEELLPGDAIQAVGHRVVHGGDDCDCPLPVTAALEARLQGLVSLAPLHLPHNLAGIAAVRARRPDLPQLACFDTAFHNALPRIARLTGLPRRFEKEGIRRYGFHGLSYEYILDELRRRHGEEAAKGRVIVAHLGNGASMAAIDDSRSVETTMGFSTLAGLPMGTRCGDLDPGIVLYLLMEKGMSAEQVQDLLYRQSGLLGISGLSRNMKDLLADLPDNRAAKEAVDFFCYQARRHLAGLAVSLGGLDRLIFTGGIGANAPEVRERICDGLGFLGIVLDGSHNAGGNRIISTDTSPVAVEAFPTDEELMIARHVRHFLDRQHVAKRA